MTTLQRNHLGLISNNCENGSRYIVQYVLPSKRIGIPNIIIVGYLYYKPTYHPTIVAIWHIKYK